MAEWGNAKRGFENARPRPHGSGFAVFLDEDCLRTPAGAEIVLPGKGLAAALCAEWRAQGDIIDPLSMPLTRLAATAIDRVGPRRGDLGDVMIRFAVTDLLCYRADEPADLVARQENAWQPLLDWAADSLGAKMAITTGVIPVEQPEAALQALRAAIDKLDDYELAAVSSIAAASGSLVMALALAAGRIDAETACSSAQLDELFQAELWGEDDEALERRERNRADILAAAAFLELYRGA